MPNQESGKDRLFATARLPGDFVFDDKVAKVFEDMINRSVPGYSTIVAMIGVLAERYCQPGSTVYDLGSSLGGASLAVANAVSHQDYRLIAVDNSPAMMRGLQQKLEQLDSKQVKLECRCEDIAETDISNASVVILNFTLQFIPLQQRDALIDKIFAGMRAGGILIVSEKIVFPNQKLNSLFIDLYHGFKETMGYSKMEISQKRTALENVLKPEALSTHRSRLERAGFQAIDVWFQCFNFASLVAFR